LTKKSFKKFFIKHLLVITIVFPLFLILFYSEAVSFILKYKHEEYSKKELKNYEKELRLKSLESLKEKSKYIASFLEFIYKENKESELVKETFNLVSSIKYDNGFIYFYQKQGNIINIVGHPCGEKLFDLVQAENKNSIVSKLLSADEKGTFIHYKGTDCKSDTFINKIAIVQNIKSTNYAIVISENDGYIAIEEKKKLFQKKLDDEMSGNLKLLLLVSFVSIIFSLLFSKVLNKLIIGYEKEIEDNNNVMFAQSRLAQAGELLSMISHQWRQPIGKIASTASTLRLKMMMGKEISREELDKKLIEIENYTEFASETIDDFQKFYKPKKVKDAIFVLPIVSKSIKFLKNEIAQKEIVVKEKYDKDVKVLVYENELIQVIVNILKNAIEFSKDRASIYISTEVKESEYIISIKDEAGGINEENIDKIFEANFSTKSDNKLENLGLGLYVSKVIIEKHFNGKLEVTSENENSTFIIRLVR